MTGKTDDDKSMGHQDQPASENEAEVEQQFLFNMIKTSRKSLNMSYVKTNYTRACRVGDDFALSFFQVDYQILVDGLQIAPSPGSVAEVDFMIPVAKIVMNRENFIQLHGEINKLAEKVGIK